MLENIGFYTLNDRRARDANINSPLWRCELILTSACNFNCPYCRGFREEDKRTISYAEAQYIVKYWASERLQNIRFSGGEPTLWPHLVDLVSYARSLGIRRVAISTNGSASLPLYLSLIQAGCNDLSISLDACCASTAETMAGKEGVYDTIISNIEALSKITYVTVGVVLTDTNVVEVNKIVELSSSLGVADIRLIGSAQENEPLKALEVREEILARHPILRYRYDNVKSGRHVRGIRAGDSGQCSLALDDMAVLNAYHYPCIIYMREHGRPIGTVGKTTRKDRENWVKSHDSFSDPICRKNCLDVCVDYNNTWEKFHSKENQCTSLERMTSRRLSSSAA